MFLPRLERDTMLAHHSCFQQHAEGPGFPFLDVLQTTSTGRTMARPGTRKPARISSGFTTARLRSDLLEIDIGEQQTVDKLGVRVVHDFQQSLYGPVLRTMNKGHRVNVAKRQSFAMELMDEIAKRQTWINEVLGHELNIRSSKTNARPVLTPSHSVPSSIEKPGSVSCDDEALGKSCCSEPLLRPLVKRFKSSVVLAFSSPPSSRLLWTLTVRMRCNFNIAGTETYRFSSSTNAFGTGLNLQKYPRGRR